MPQFTVNSQRFDPYKNFKFRVKWDGRYVAGVCKVGALKRTTEVVKHREGGDPSSSRKSPGKTEFEAISLERSRLPWQPAFAGVLRDGLVGNSLQQTLGASGIRTIGGSEAVSLVRLGKEDAGLLGRVEGDAFLATRRTVHDAAGHVVERVDSLLHPDHFRLQFNFGEQPR